MTDLYVMTFKLRDGRTVRVRRMLPADVNHLVHIYRYLSPESLYLRFQEPAANLPPIRVLEEARRLAESGYTQGKGFLAFVDLPGKPGAPIAGARYVRVSPEAAEISITVRDDFQRQGVGSNLLTILLREARSEGIRKIIANVSVQNQAILHLLNRFPWPIRKERYGPELYIEADISAVTITEKAPSYENSMAPTRSPRIQPGRNVKSAPTATNRKHQSTRNEAAIWGPDKKRPT